ncbi:hypothetical protein PUN28_020735 [Cardiocondyla obscurior]|uniref:Uncharacterized protein n=1 Tax=Cardiocondyla obscurior TaxID=286306 RepID=A0AAW2E543_9HYME
MRKTGHTGRECKNSRHANRFSLPRADANEEVNATSKYCTHCNINGHIREDLNTTTRAYTQDADSSDEERYSTTWATHTSLLEMCDNFCDTFYLDGDTLTCTKAVAHEISMDEKAKPINSRPYRLSHRTLAEYLKHYLNEEQTDWDEWLPYAMFTYNTTPHTATGFTPFELIYGHQALLPTAVSGTPKQTYSYEDYVQELRERQRASNFLAKEHAKEEKLKAKINFDIRTNPKSFKVGDSVLLHDETVRRGRSKKLDKQWVGPYVIIEKHGEINYTIKKGRKTIRVHANR